MDAALPVLRGALWSWMGPPSVRPGSLRRGRSAPPPPPPPPPPPHPPLPWSSMEWAQPAGARMVRRSGPAGAPPPAGAGGGAPPGRAACGSMAAPGQGEALCLLRKMISFFCKENQENLQKGDCFSGQIPGMLGTNQNPAMVSFPATGAAEMRRGSSTMSKDILSVISDQYEYLFPRDRSLIAGFILDILCQGRFHDMPAAWARRQRQ